MALFRTGEGKRFKLEECPLEPLKRLAHAYNVPLLQDYEKSSASV